MDAWRVGEPGSSPFLGRCSTRKVRGAGLPASVDVIGVFNIPMADSADRSEKIVIFPIFAF